MDIQPLKRYPTPKYPTQTATDSQPDLLRAVPRRWQGKAAVLAALTATCGIAAARWAAAEDAPTAPTTGDTPPAAVSHVAPVFPHGAGRGFYGGDMSMSGFLSEDDAREIIQLELNSAGIDCAPTEQTVELMVPKLKLTQVTETVQNGDGSCRTVSMNRHLPFASPLSLTLDGADAKRQIAYEYVSLTDYSKWSIYIAPPASEGSFISSRGTADFKQTAAVVSEALAQAKPPGAYGVFYEPLITSAQVLVDTPIPAIDRDGTKVLDYRKINEHRQEMARAALRAQVKDFLAWLKAEGVI